MEPVPDPRPGGDAGAEGAGRRVLGPALAGALFAAAGAAALGLALDLLSRRAGPALAAAAGLRSFLDAGGWLRVPLWGGALGALRGLAWARRAPDRARSLSLAAGLLALSLLLHPAVAPPGPGVAPRTAAAKATAIRRWSYQSPEGVRKILLLSRDPDARVRELAVLALGVNRVVADLERPEPEAASRPAVLRLRDDMRARLEECLRDSSVSMRAEAARALWKAPRAFGLEPAAAETLAAILDRGPGKGVPERLMWLALDAAAGAPHPALERAAARFAAATADTALRRAAARAARPDSGRAWRPEEPAAPGAGR